MYAGFSFFLGRLDKGSSNVAVFIKCKGKGNPWFFWISLCCRKTGFRNTCNNICFYRIRLGKRFTTPDSGIINLYSIDCTVKAGKINILKYTMCLFCTGKFHIGFQSIFCDSKNFARFNITDKLRTHWGQRTAFRSNYISISSFSQA